MSFLGLESQINKLEKYLLNYLKGTNERISRIENNLSKRIRELESDVEELKKSNAHISLNSSLGENWKTTQRNKILSTHRTQKLAELAEKVATKKSKVYLFTHGKDEKSKSKEDSFKKNLKWAKNKEY